MDGYEPITKPAKLYEFVAPCLIVEEWGTMPRPVSERRVEMGFQIL